MTPRFADARARRWQPRVWAPLLALACGAAIAALLYATRPVPVKQPPQTPVPLVRTLRVEPQSLRLRVVAHGTVTPRTQSDLVAEVRGRVTQVSPRLVAGGFFEQGDVLLGLDDREYRIAVKRARASLAVRESEARLADSELRRRRELARRSATSAAELEEVENRAIVAAAELDDARARLAQALLDLERTIVRAPFDGRVRSRSVDLGQFVVQGTPLARIQATDHAEVRLPVNTDELAHLELPQAPSPGTPSGGAFAGEGAPVALHGRFGGASLVWPARLVRAEGEVDPRTRMVYVVARVDDPYARRPDAAGRTPLPAGLFVRAEIEGREVRDVFVLPPMALRDADRVFVVDADERLRVRPVGIVRRDRDHVIVGSGLQPGDRVVISPLRVFSEGMQLRTVEAPAP